jgi:hypothetical protein
MNALHGYSKRQHPGVPLFADLDVDNISPDFLVEPGWNDYIAGKDPVIDLVLWRVRRK